MQSAPREGIINAMERIPLEGSARAVQNLLEDPDPLERVRVTLHLKGERHYTPAEVMAHGALPPGLRSGLPGRDIVPQAGLDALRTFAASHGLSIIREDAAAHCMDLEGPAQSVAEAFGMQWAATPEGHRVAQGTLSLPAPVAPWVEGILGLDARPRMRPHVHQHPHEALGEALGGYDVPSLAERYAFPAGSGKGQRVGLIELGGGFKPDDLETFFSSFGWKVPSIRVVSVDGAQNDPAHSPMPENMEVTLDIEVLGALVPDAEVVLYMAPNTDQGFTNALKAAMHDPAGAPSVISISWGSAEAEWGWMDSLLFSDAVMDAGAAGITVVASSGDRGSREAGPDKPAMVNFPASSPWAMGCGGTTLNGEGERVWNTLASTGPFPGASGGGVSDLFEVPEYQKNLPLPVAVSDGKTRRVVPDVGAVADGTTGYRVYVNGAWMVLGGTSAAAPLWAALIARCNEALGKPCGFLHPFLYGDEKARAAFHSVDEGSNGDYLARPAFDACTGLGTPHGLKLLEALKGDHLSKTV